MSGHLPHPRREVARLDALRRRREIAERLGDAACGPVGEQRHDPDEAEPEKDEDADERALRLIDTRGGDENGEEAGILPRRSKDAEDAVVVRVVRRHVLDEDVALLRVNLGDAREHRIFAEVDRGGADLAVPDQRKVGVGPRLDARRWSGDRGFRQGVPTGCRTNLSSFRTATLRQPMQNTLAPEGASTNSPEAVRCGARPIRRV